MCIITAREHLLLPTERHHEVFYLFLLVTVRYLLVVADELHLVAPHTVKPKQNVKIIPLFSCVFC